MRKIYGMAGVTAVMGVLVFSAVGAASASASSWWVGGEELLSSTALSSTTVTKVPIRLENPSYAFAFECTGLELKTADIAAHNAGQIEHLVFTSCHSTSSHCSLVGTKIESKPLKMEAALGEKSPEDKVVLKPVTGKLFMEFSVGGTGCTVAEEGAEIEGQATFILPKGREESAEQEVQTHAKEGELKGYLGAWTLGGTVKAKLTSGKKWSFH
jgi:hypothetical protein